MESSADNRWAGRAAQDDEEEADDMTNAIFEELQLGAFEGVGAVPSGPVAAAPEPVPAEAEDADVVRSLLLSTAIPPRARLTGVHASAPRPRLRSLMVAWWRQDQMMARLAALKA
eukprot:COSAG04_NODE_810_length_10113_cov_60.334731_9_plen_115_part_00